MAQIHFFTELDKLKNQPLFPLPLNSEYGPINNSQYRVTSLHSSIIDAKCIAICNGNIRFQEDNSNPNLLNMVLYPINVDFKGIPVKYFIYRGIKKNSLIDENNQILIENPNNLTILEIIKKINLINNTNNEQIPSLNCLGIGFNSENTHLDFHLEDDEVIDSLFFENTSFKPIKVEAGDTLGFFDKSLFGIEVILENRIYEPTLDILRNVNLGTSGNVLDINNIDFALDKNNPSNQEIRAYRERILSYLDPCAFYSTFYSDGIVIQGGTVVSKDQLYDQILCKYSTCNTVYIDIRNQNGMSLNYYNQYAGENCNIKIDLSGDFSNSLADTNYNTLSWPVKIINSSDFEHYNHYLKKSLIRISLPISGDNAPKIYLAFAPLYSRNKKINWIKFYPFPKFETKYKKFLSLKKNGNWSEDLLLATRYIKETKQLCSYIKFYYVDIMNNNYTNGTTSIVNTQHYLDNLFSIKNLSKYKKWSNSFSTNYYLDGNEKYLSFYYKKSLRFEGMVKTGVAIDEHRITFYAIPFESTLKKYRFDNNELEGSSSNPSFYQIFNKKNIIRKGLEKQFNNDNIEISGTILTYDNLSNLYTVSFLKNEFNELTNSILNFEYNVNLHPIFLGVQQPSYINDFTIDFKLTGYKSNGKSYNNNINLRGLTVDGKIICTNEAAKIENVEITNFSPNYVIDISCSPYERIILSNVIEDIKLFNNELYNNILKQLNEGSFQKFPLEDNKRKVQFKINIKFEDLDDKIGGTTSPPRFFQKSVDKKVFNGDSISYLKTDEICNYSDYINLSTNNQSVDEFKPLLITQFRSTNNQGHIIYIENGTLELEKGKQLGYGALDYDQPFTIKLNKKYITPNTILFNKFKDEYNYEVVKVSGNSIYSKEHNERRLELGRILSHELGHVLYWIIDPLTAFAWDILEKQVRLSYPKDTNDPNPLKNFNDGHIKGSPDGKNACKNDLLFYTKYAEKINNEINEIIINNAPLSSGGSSTDYPIKGSKNIPGFDFKYCSNNL